MDLDKTSTQIKKYIMWQMTWHVTWKLGDVKLNNVDMVYMPVMPHQSSGFLLYYVCNNFLEDVDGDINIFFLTSTKTL